MSNDIKFEISIPADNDGYILLRCSHCGEYFKLLAKDCEDDGILNIYCPSCGLISESYLTQDVIELAQAIASNYAMDMIYEAFKDMEKSTKKNSFVSFKAGKRLRREAENPIEVGIEALEIADFDCCRKTAKRRQNTSWPYWPRNARRNLYASLRQRFRKTLCFG